MVNPSQRPAVTSHVDQLIRTVLLQMKIKFAASLASADDTDNMMHVREGWMRKGGGRG